MMAGETADTIVLSVVPSLYTKVHGEIPVKATDKFTVLPVQILCVPVKVAVGDTVTVTLAVPLVVPEVEQLASLTLFKV